MPSAGCVEDSISHSVYQRAAGFDPRRGQGTQRKRQSVGPQGIFSWSLPRGVFLRCELCWPRYRLLGLERDRLAFSLYIKAGAALRQCVVSGQQLTSAGGSCRRELALCSLLLLFNHPQSFAFRFTPQRFHVRLSYSSGHLSC